ncbi:MAG TPA: hypothetical protein DD434_10390, partial [Bacteroidales bacterium]|nr:hypothetical protein [Bacteroidales bacterium]
MFEIGVCEDCGEIAIIGKIENHKLVRASISDNREFYQIYNLEDLDKENEKENIHTLCKTCGAIVDGDEVLNKCCTCENT